jgi:tripartite-type tricarboxylate transporter receptor subunit TctC
MIRFNYNNKKGGFMRTLRSLVVRMFLVGLIVFGVGAAWGQSYPNKPIRIITADAGGVNDVHARAIAPGLSEILGQPVIVENRGGSSLIPIGAVQKAPPDGYSLLLLAAGLWYQPFMQSVSYDPLKDFAPITMMTTAPAVVVVNPSVPVKSIKELIAMAKAQPGKLQYGAGSPGSIMHMSAELFKAMAGIDIGRVAYKGVAPTLTALMGGEVQVAFLGVNSALSAVKSGKLRALAVTSDEPSSLYPGLPTVAAAGLPGFQMATVQGLFAPGKTPAPVIKRLRDEIVRVLNKPEVKELLLKSGAEVVGSTSEQFTAYIKADMARMGKVIKDAGITAE